MELIATKQQIPYLKTLATVVPGTHRKSQGMYVGEKDNPNCKQNKNILITAAIDYNDTYEVTTSEQYKRNVYKNGKLIHKVGDFKKKKVCKVKVFKSFPNLSFAWAAAADYPTVSYGFTNWQRNALIIDSDQEYDCLQEAVNTFTRFAKHFGIPKPNSVLRNPKSRHAQAAWFLGNPFYTKDFYLFNTYTKKMANAYRDFTGKDADICFNGPACKNPYYKGFESAFLNNCTVDIDDFDGVYDYIPNIESLAKYNNITPLSSYSSYNNTNVTKLKSVIKSTSKSNHYFGDETSRDYWECKWLREWVWTYMRHNEHAPTYPEARAKMNEFAQAAAKKTGKTVHEFSELNAITKCTLNWAIKKFDSSIICGYNEKAADQGRLIHSLQSYVAITKICELKRLGRTCREIASMTGYSIASVSRAKLENIDFGKVVDWLEYYREADSKYQEEYKQLFTAIIYIYNTLPSSLLSYNNTNVTNSTETTYTDIIDDFLNEDLDWNEYCCKYYLLFGTRATFTDWVHYYKEHDYDHFRQLLAS